MVFVYSRKICISVVASIEAFQVGTSFMRTCMDPMSPGTRDPARVCAGSNKMRTSRSTESILDPRYFKNLFSFFIKKISQS